MFVCFFFLAFLFLHTEIGGWWSSERSVHSRQPFVVLVIMSITFELLMITCDFCIGMWKCVTLQPQHNYTLIPIDQNELRQQQAIDSRSRRLFNDFFNYLYHSFVILPLVGFSSSNWFCISFYRSCSRISVRNKSSFLCELVIKILTSATHQNDFFIRYFVIWSIYYNNELRWTKEIMYRKFETSVSLAVTPSKCILRSISPSAK